jgi:hypothetical protein
VLQWKFSFCEEKETIGKIGEKEITEGKGEGDKGNFLCPKKRV